MFSPNSESKRSKASPKIVGWHERTFPFQCLSSSSPLLFSPLLLRAAKKVLSFFPLLPPPPPRPHFFPVKVLITGYPPPFLLSPSPPTLSSPQEHSAVLPTLLFFLPSDLFCQKLFPLASVREKQFSIPAEHNNSREPSLPIPRGNCTRPSSLPASPPIPCRKKSFLCPLPFLVACPLHTRLHYSPSSYALYNNSIYQGLATSAPTDQRRRMEFSRLLYFLFSSLSGSSSTSPHGFKTPPPLSDVNRVESSTLSWSLTQAGRRRRRPRRFLGWGGALFLGLVPFLLFLCFFLLFSGPVWEGGWMEDGRGRKARGEEGGECCYSCSLGCKSPSSVFPLSSTLSYSQSLS